VRGFVRVFVVVVVVVVVVVFNYYPRSLTRITTHAV